MKKAPVPKNDLERIDTLKDYNILDTIEEKHFDEITETAASICGCSISLISLVDKDRLWFKSKKGIDADEKPREISYCGHAILSDDIFIVEDATKDPRFSDNPLLLKKPNVRFYAGAPLIASNGHRIGTLCVIDSKPKKLSEDKKLLLKTLAKQVINYLEIKKKDLQTSKRINEIEFYKKGLDKHAIIVKTDINGKFTYVNDKFCEISKFSRDELIGQDHKIVSSDTHKKDFFKDLWSTISSGNTWRGEIRNKAKDGTLYWVDTTILPFKDENGNIIEFMAFRYDITQKKEAEFLNKKIQDINSIGGWKLNLETFTPIWTDEVYKIHEVDIGEEIDITNAINYYAPHERDRVTKLVNRCVEEGIPFEGDFEFITAKGNKKWVHSKGFPEYDAQGNVVRLIGTFQDVTEKKKTEILLKDNEKKLTQLFNQSKDPIMTLEPPLWKFSSCNQATLDLFNISSEQEFTSLGPWSVSPEKQPDGVLSSQKAETVIKEAMENGSNFFEWTHSTIDGKEIPCTVLLSRIKEDDKVYLHAVVRDISEQKKLEKELIESNQYLDLSLEGAGLGVWDWDFTNNNVKFDRRWAEMLGLDITKIVMNLSTWKDRVHPDDLETCYSELKDYLKGKTDRYENIHRLRHEDGHWVFILAKGRVSEWDQDGRPIRFTGTHLDITEAKERERELDLILNSNNIGIWRFNPLSNELFWDKSMYDLYEVDPNTFSGAFDAWLKTLHKSCEEITPKEFEASLNGNSDTFETIFKIVNAKGEVKDIGARAIIERDSNGKAIFVTGVNWDRTKEQQAVDEANKQIKISQHHAKLASIGELAAGVGHEINNPLAIVKGYISAIKKKTSKNQIIEYSALETYLNKINSATDRIASIVQGLRTFSRSDSTAISEFDPVGAVDESFNMINEIYKKDGIDISFTNNIDAHNLLSVGNRGNFQQVLMNLISNAKDAVSNNQEKKISIECFYENSILKIEVKDNGSGILKELQEKIFDPFFTTKEVNQGTGIGLSLAHNFIKEMSGEIRVKVKKKKDQHLLLNYPFVLFQNLAHQLLKNLLKNPQSKNIQQELF